MSIFLITLPIFLIILSGWLLKKFKVVTNEWIRILNDFAYYVALPALIISAFGDIDFLNNESLRLIFWSLLIVVLFCSAVFIMLSFFKISQKMKASILLSATVGNTLYMGTPLIELGFGKEFLPSAALVGVIFLIIPLMFVIALIQCWYCREHCFRKELAGFIKNPLVISALVGVFLSLFKFDYPLILDIKKSITMLGATASPVALFALGGFLYGRFLRKDLGLVFLISFLKIIAFPLAIIVASGFLAKTNSFQTLTLLSAMPVAVTAFVIAEKFNLHKDLIGNSVLISTIFSFITAPIIISVFSISPD
jgi:predicted permease